jgi:hypothetical protein
LRSTKFAIASSAASKRSPESTTARRRLGGDHRVPGLQRVEPVEDLAGVRAQASGQLRVELTAAALPRDRRRGLDPAGAVRHLDELRQMGDARRDRDGIALELTGPSAAVPHLVRGGERGQDVAREPQLLAERAGDARVLATMSSTSRWPENANSSPTRKRCSGGRPAPIWRMPAAAARRLPSWWSYLPAFSAMSSPNHLACSCASVWQPTLTSSAV